MIRKHTISIKNAFRGLVWAFSTQPNYRIHITLSLLAIGGGVLYKIAYQEWMVIVLFITLGLAVETINTAIEEATDAIDTKIRDDIRIAKDVSAGAMLVVAIGALLVSGVIFLPKILSP